jgi:hypothetical protein
MKSQDHLSIDEKNIYIFYGMYCVNDCLDRFLKTYNKIQKCGLLERCKKIYVTLVGNDSNYVDFIKTNIVILPKIEILIKENSNCEPESLNLIWEKSQNEDFYCLFLHSKGVTRLDRNVSFDTMSSIDCWVDYLEYFCIEKWKDCISFLPSYDTCSCEMKEKPLKHYSGNFWWSKSDYIKKLTKLELSVSRKYCEFWLFDNEYCKMKSLHQTPPNTNLYKVKYDRKSYEQ